MKKVLFISRHDMTAEMKNLLTEKLGKVSVDKVELIFNDGNEIVPFIGKYNEFIIVAPNEVLQLIISKGVRPLQFIMSYRNEDGSPSTSPRLKGLKRIITIQEELL